MNRAEDELLRLAAEGDQQAFRALVESYAMLAERTALALLGDRSLAEDAVQEAWLDVWRAMPRFEQGRPFRPWLLTIVANRARKHTRRRRLPWVSLDLALLSDRASEQETSPFAWPEKDDPVGIALATLGEDQRQVLALRYMADLELEEIARLTEVPLGTVKSRLHRALKTLRARLQEGSADARWAAGVERSE